MQINIQDIIPFMKKGWVAMDKNGRWYWHHRKPKKLNSPWNYWDSKGSDFELLMFKIAPVDDWTKSLIKVGKKMTCKQYCPVWNDIDKDCELYGEHHFTPRTCPHYNLEILEKKMTEKFIEENYDTSQSPRNR